MRRSPLSPQPSASAPPTETVQKSRDDFMASWGNIPRKESEKVFQFQNNSERNAYCPTRRPVPPDFLDISANSKCAKHSGLESEKRTSRFLLPAAPQSRAPIVPLPTGEEEESGMEDHHQTLWVRLNNLVGGYSTLADSDIPQLRDSSCALMAAKFRGSGQCSFLVS